MWLGESHVLGEWPYNVISENVEGQSGHFVVKNTTGFIIQRYREIFMNLF